MWLTRQRPLRWTLSLLVLVLVSTSPGAMAVMAASHGAPAASHRHGSSGPQHHHLPANCCDLCVASCIACGGIAPREGGISRPAVLARSFDATPGHGRLVALSFPHRLPPPVGPPS